jgi:hypothetical protein
MRHLECECRFPDAGFTREEDERSGCHPISEDGIELTRGTPYSLWTGNIDTVDLFTGMYTPLHTDTIFLFWSARLCESIPFTTVRALSGPLRKCLLTGLTLEHKGNYLFIIRKEGKKAKKAFSNQLSAVSISARLPSLHLIPPTLFS